jgi:hypothetical protein
MKILVVVEWLLDAEDPMDGRAPRADHRRRDAHSAALPRRRVLSVYDEILERLGSRSDRVLNALAELVDATELTADARDSTTA